MPNADLRRSSSGQQQHVSSRKVAPAAPPDDLQPRKEEDYYQYYKAAQRRVSRWVDDTQQFDSYVPDDYPGSVIDFREASTSGATSVSGMTRMGGERIIKIYPGTESATTESVAFGGGGSEGTMKRERGFGKRASHGELDVAMAAKGSRETLKSRGATAAELDRRSEFRSSKGDGFARRLDIDEMTEVTVVVPYPDIRARSVVPDNEPTFTEVMGRYGKRQEVSSRLPDLASSSVNGSGSRSGRRPSVQDTGSAEFEISWTFMQPIVILVSSSMFFVAVIPSAAAVVAIMLVIAVVYYTDVLPDLFPRPRKSSSSSSSRRKSESHRSTRSRRSR